VATLIAMLVRDLGQTISLALVLLLALALYFVTGRRR
jgi:hypothetical protein